jgi:hypothetical protein
LARSRVEEVQGEEDRPNEDDVDGINATANVIVVDVVVNAATRRTSRITPTLLNIIIIIDLVENKPPDVNLAVLFVCYVPKSSNNKKLPTDPTAPSIHPLAWSLPRASPTLGHTTLLVLRVMLVPARCQVVLPPRAGEAPTSTTSTPHCKNRSSMSR